MQTPQSHTSPIHDVSLSSSSNYPLVVSHVSVTMPERQVNPPWHPTLTPYRLLVVLFITYVGATTYMTRTRYFEDHSHDSPPILVMGWILAVVLFIGLYVLRLVEKRKGPKSWTTIMLHEVDCLQTLKDWLRLRVRRGIVDKGKASSRLPDDDPEVQAHLLDEFPHDDGSKRKDKSDPPVEQFVLEEAPFDNHFKVTIFRLLVAVLFFCFVLYKACTAYPEVEWKEAGDGSILLSPNLISEHGIEVECIFETLGVVVIYWLSL
ncbi:hypothetical protein BJ165DRAFT_658775 [Panaeolus papilionaceus]|nr:hypothetical protein BJ165DRAFT_658775 [Panaeolus papilionaceus]